MENPLYLLIAYLAFGSILSAVLENKDGDDMTLEITLFWLPLVGASAYHWVFHKAKIFFAETKQKQYLRK